MVSASLLDNYNKIVASIRDKATLIQPTTVEATANAQGSTRAEAPLRAGQMLAPKIGNVKIYSEPSRDSAVVGTLQRGDELVASGETQNGFAHVDAANFSGWVQRTLVGPVAGVAPVAMAPCACGCARTDGDGGAAVALRRVRGHGRRFRHRFLSPDHRRQGRRQWRRAPAARLGGFGLLGTYVPSDGTLQMLGSSGGGGGAVQGPLRRVPRGLQRHLVPDQRHGHPGDDRWQRRWWLVRCHATCDSSSVAVSPPWRTAGLHHPFVLGQFALDEAGELIRRGGRRLGHQRRHAGLQLGRAQRIDEGLVQPARQLGGQPRRPNSPNQVPMSKSFRPRPASAATVGSSGSRARTAGGGDGQRLQLAAA